MSAAISWITSDDTGISSKAIWSHMMTGEAPADWWLRSEPADPDDFGRCHRLLLRVPEWRPRIGEMAKYSHEWAALVAVWDELTAMYEAITSSGINKPTPRDWDLDASRRLYDRMTELRFPNEKGAA